MVYHNNIAWYAAKSHCIIACLHVSVKQTKHLGIIQVIPIKLEGDPLTLRIAF